MAGYPGSGKSTLARRLADRLGAYYLSSDVVRQELFQSSRYDTAGDSVVSPQRDQVYHYMAERVLQLLADSKQLILDATNLETAQRAVIIDTLLKQLVPEELCFVCVKTPYKVIKQRLRALDTQVNTPAGHALTGSETLLQGWQRVYAIFRNKYKQGLISWPKSGAIRVFHAPTIYAYLDQTT